MTAAGSDGQAVVDNDRRHVFHSWSVQGEALPAVARAEGSVFWDYEGNRYLDFSSQLVNTNLGHQHPYVVEAIKRQADRLCTIAPSFANDVRGELAAALAAVAPGDLNRTFFTNGGADAVEHAMRMARLHTGRHKILAAYRSYHGATAGAIALTGDPRRWGSEPGAPSVVRFHGPYLYRSPFHATTPAEECERALQHLAETMMLEGPHTIAAVILEPIVGTNGVLVPPDGYLQGVRELCDKHGIVLICDEVMSGFGRAGQWFAVDEWAVTPDLITFAKGVNSGYVPLGGVLVSDAITDTFRQRPYPGGLTYSGHPLACASALATLEVYRRDGLIDRAAELGRTVVGPGLEQLRLRHRSVGEVRGRGLFWAIELVRDRDSREMLVPFNASGDAAAPIQHIVAECRRRGLVPFAHFNRIHVVPPLVIEDGELKQGLEILDDVLDIADTYADAAA